MPAPAFIVCRLFDDRHSDYSEVIYLIVVFIFIFKFLFIYFSFCWVFIAIWAFL